MSSTLSVDENLSIRLCGLGQVAHFEILGPHISSEWSNIETWYLVHILHTASISHCMANYP